MAATMRADIAKAMYVGAKEIFKKNLKKNRVEEWKQCCTIKNSDKMEETYETIGNLQAAYVKAEGDPLVYGKIIDGHTTTLKNDTIANGFEVTMEAKEDEKWGIVPEVKVSEMARTMHQKREKAVAAVWDATRTAVGADGVAHAATNHPLLNSASVNNNLINKAFDDTVYEEACNMFNDWMNHTGEKFDTMPTAILAHRNRMTYILAMLQSTLLAFEASNTKNTLEKLKPIFNRYIAKLPVFIIDETIDSVVFQRRKGIELGYDYDKRSTFNFYFNTHERYVAGVINPGFGFIRINGEVVV